VYEILYQKVFAELDRKEHAVKGSKQHPSTDLNNMMTTFYQNGLGEDDTFEDDIEDNSGWTEVVRGRSNKGKCGLTSSFPELYSKEKFSRFVTVCGVITLQGFVFVPN